MNRIPVFATIRDAYKDVCFACKEKNVLLAFFLPFLVLGASLDFLDMLLSRVEVGTSALIISLVDVNPLFGWVIEHAHTPTYLVMTLVVVLVYMLLDVLLAAKWYKREDEGFKFLSMPSRFGLFVWQFVKCLAVFVVVSGVIAGFASGFFYGLVYVAQLGPVFDPMVLRDILIVSVGVILVALSVWLIVMAMSVTLIIPAAAKGYKVSLLDSLKLLKGQKWRFVSALLLALVPLVVVSFVLHYTVVNFVLIHSLAASLLLVLFVGGILSIVATAVTASVAGRCYDILLEACEES